MTRRQAILGIANGERQGTEPWSGNGERDAR